MKNKELAKWKNEEPKHKMREIVSSICGNPKNIEDLFIKIQRLSV